MLRNSKSLDIRGGAACLNATKQDHQAVQVAKKMVAAVARAGPRVEELAAKQVVKREDVSSRA